MRIRLSLSLDSPILRSEKATGNIFTLASARRIFAFDLGITKGVPHVCVTPDEEIDERAQKMGLAGAVFGLHPKALPLAVHDAIEDTFEVRPQRRGEMIVSHSLARLGSRDRLRKARCRLWLRFDSDDSVELRRPLMINTTMAKSPQNHS
jgi:hypothetical protein